LLIEQKIRLLAPIASLENDSFLTSAFLSNFKLSAVQGIPEKASFYFDLGVWSFFRSYRHKQNVHHLHTSLLYLRLHPPIIGFNPI
jgi:hypothetical protein